MMILLATGVMDLGTMAIVTAAITVERLSPRPQHATSAAGVGIILTGYPAFESAVQAIEDEVDGYFVKPADIHYGTWV